MHIRSVWRVEAWVAQFLDKPKKYGNIGKAFLLKRTVLGIGKQEQTNAAD